MLLNTKILTVSIIGSGNVAGALGNAFLKNGIIVSEIYSLNPQNSKLLASKLGCSYVKTMDELNADSDLYIIAIPDKEIASVSSLLARVNGIVVHTSGSVPISVLSDCAFGFGVFYPLQTFTMDSKAEFNDIPICIEGVNNDVTNSLKQLAEKISNNVVVLNSEQRRYLHLTAVTVNNFTNWLYGMAHGMLLEKDIDFSLLHPLINETASKISSIHPATAQTGPARRNDISTINDHLELLRNYPDYKKLYTLISDQIIKKYHD